MIRWCSRDELCGHVDKSKILQGQYDGLNCPCSEIISTMRLCIITYAKIAQWQSMPRPILFRCSIVQWLVRWAVNRWFKLPSNVGIYPHPLANSNIMSMLTMLLIRLATCSHMLWLRKTQSPTLHNHCCLRADPRRCSSSQAYAYGIYEFVFGTVVT